MLCKSFFAFLLVASAVQAFEDKNFPRPGLYKSQLVQNKIDHGKKITTTYDGNKNGGTTITQSSSNTKTVKNYADTDSQTYCLKETAVIPKQMGCQPKPGISTPDAYIIKTDCMGMKTTITFKKLNDNLYDQVLHMEQGGSSAPAPMGMPNQAMMESMVEAQPPEKRAEMRKQLQKMYSPEAKAKMDEQMKMAAASQKQAAEDMKKELANETDPQKRAQLEMALKQMQSFTPGVVMPKVVDSHYTLTRLGDCK